MSRFPTCRNSLSFLPSPNFLRDANVDRFHTPRGAPFRIGSARSQEQERREAAPHRRPQAATRRPGGHVRPRRRLRGPPADRSHYFVAVASRRRVEDDQRRHHLDAGLRRRGVVLDRLRRDRPEEPERRLGRHRREQQPAERRLRRRRLQVASTAARRWQNVGLEDSPSTSARSSSTRATPTRSTSRRRGRSGGRAATAGCTRRPTAARRGTKVLNINENTGVTDVVLDPRNPDVLLAASYQRRRHVWTLINGGPGERHPPLAPTAARRGRRSRPACPAATWAASAWRWPRPIPDVDLRHRRGGRQARAASSARTDRGVTWEKRNPFDAQAQYYAHIVVDPENKDRIYVDERLHPGLRRRRQDARAARRAVASTSITTTSGSTRSDPNYYLVGCDGGIYESFDRGANWRLQAEPAGHAVLRRRLRRERRRSTTSTAARRTTSPSAARPAPAARTAS